MSGDRPCALSLFAGAGGLDVGVEQAGYQVFFALELDRVAVDTLNRNRERHLRHLPEVEALDITHVQPEEVMERTGIDSGQLELLVGGPPCVAFSKSGFHLDYKRAGADPRAALLDRYVDYLEVLRPRAFLMENVYGLAYRNQSADVYQRFRGRIEALGYSFTDAVLNAADYGVPQNRQRLFVIGSRDGPRLRHPKATHWGEHERRRPPRDLAALLPHVTAGEALEGLSTHPEPGEEVNGKWGHLLPEIPPGGNYLHFTEHEGHPRPLFRWRSRYWTFLLKLDPNRPAPTLQAQPGPYVGPFHWEDRRLRVPELKRLHGIPDDYEFAGTRREVQVQVGNAVPPPLARVIAETIRRQTIVDERDQADYEHDSEPQQVDLEQMEPVSRA